MLKQYKYTIGIYFIYHKYIKNIITIIVLIYYINILKEKY